MTTFRACYYVARDGQSDILLTSEDQAHLPDADLLAAAMAEADDTGLPQFLVDQSHADAEYKRHLGDDDHETLSLDMARELVRQQLRIGDYTD